MWTKWGCKASVLCAPGFTGDRCSECADRWYRSKSTCERCPELSMLYMFIFVLALMALLGAANVLMRLGTSLAPLTIAMDYFQVLGRFGSIDLQWSNSTMSLLNSFEFFELDIQLTAPECFVKAGFHTKWLGVQSLPLICAGMLLAQYLMWLVVARKISQEVKLRQRERLAGVMLLMLQERDMTLVSKTLEVFDCNPLADGSRVLAADPTIICGTAEHKRLQLLGSVTTVVYLFGIPGLFAWCLLVARRRIRAARKAALSEEVAIVERHGIKPDEAPDGHAAATELRDVEGRLQETLLRVETTFGCLYRRFTFESQYWLLMLTARKLGITFVGTMLTLRPRTQSALILAILVIAMALQLSQKPYCRIDSGVLDIVKSSTAADKHDAMATWKQRLRRFGKML